MNPLEELLSKAPTIEAKLHYQFRDRSLLTMAFTHRSFVNENRDLVSQNNERLEFLGDSVLGLLISDYLYRYLPSRPEGDLSYLRSRLVEASSCMRYVLELDVAEHLLMGKGEQRNSGRGRESILADLFEAIVGAIYLDGGLSAIKKFIFQNFSPTIQEILQTPEQNWKALLQDFAQKNFQQTPQYEVVDESGPDHRKHFEVVVTIDSNPLGRGAGASKKEAQQAAAKKALEAVQQENAPNGNEN